MRRFLSLLCVAVLVGLVLAPSVWAVSPAGGERLGPSLGWFQRSWLVLSGWLGKAASLMDPNGFDRALQGGEPSPASAPGG